MMGILYIVFAAIICLILFVAVDMFWKLPKEGSVSGAKAIGKEIEGNSGEVHGGWMMGNIVTSPDASAGVLVAACGFFVWEIPGAILSIILIFIGARICADKGYAAVSGAAAATILIWLLTTFAGFPPASFIAGMVIAILLVQGISLRHASRILGTIWRRLTHD